MEGHWAVTGVSRFADWVRANLIRYCYRGNCECNGSYSSYVKLFAKKQKRKNKKKTFKTLKVNQQNINSLVSEMHNYWQVKSFKNIYLLIY